MPTLFDYFKYNNLPYVELSEFDKEKIDNFVATLKQNGLEKTILSFDCEKCKINIKDNIGSDVDFVSSFNSMDLVRKIMRIWLKAQ